MPTTSPVPAAPPAALAHRLRGRRRRCTAAPALAQDRSRRRRRSRPPPRPAPPPRRGRPSPCRPSGPPPRPRRRTPTIPPPSRRSPRSRCRWCPTPCRPATGLRRSTAQQAGRIIRQQLRVAEAEAVEARDHLQVRPRTRWSSWRPGSTAWSPLSPAWPPMSGPRCAGWRRPVARSRPAPSSAVVRGTVRRHRIARHHRRPQRDRGGPGPARRRCSTPTTMPCASTSPPSSR